jgi:hypothetical protein
MNGISVAGPTRTAALKVSDAACGPGLTFLGEPICPGQVVAGIVTIVRVLTRGSLLVRIVTARG